jgi:transglutaminase-like putative cysteine protease
MNKYLQNSKYIDFDNPEITRKSEQLANGALNEHDLIRHCFEFVRDEIKHSWDYKKNPVTCRASEVLHYGTGYCYAKSHLLAALLRKNGIPTGLCYQRLSVNDQGPPYCLHGLNAVYLQDYGWYRIDARGNKPGVDAKFTPPGESLAFPIHDKEERDLPEIWPEPHPEVIRVLEKYHDVRLVFENLPDIPLLG